MINDMKDNKEIIAVLNDLIKINVDRITGYEKAINNLDSSEVMLKTLFTQVSEDSVDIKSQLTEQVIALGGEPASERTLPGAIYQAWMDVKATFSGHDTGSTLEACEFGEDAAQKAYQAALKAGNDFPADIKHMITSQKSLLKMSHDLIRTQRDQHKEIAN
ncbi:MAG: PA2169 family four-helix-bundle protein [Cyclobacteriaceae bacterium]